MFFSETELPGEDAKELPFYSVHVLLGETGGGSPCFVLVRAIVGILCGVRSER